MTDKVERSTTSRRRIAAEIVVSILIGLATLIFVVRDVSAPIHRITQSMELIAKGHLEADIPYADRENELGMMARALVVFKKSLIENDRLSAATRTIALLVAVSALPVLTR